jgi:hypothetical protein
MTFIILCIWPVRQPPPRHAGLDPGIHHSSKRRIAGSSPAMTSPHAVTLRWTQRHNCTADLRAPKDGSRARAFHCSRRTEDGSQRDIYPCPTNQAISFVTAIFAISPIVLSANFLATNFNGESRTALVANCSTRTSTPGGALLGRRLASQKLTCNLLAPDHLAGRVCRPFDSPHKNVNGVIKRSRCGKRRNLLSFLDHNADVHAGSFNSSGVRPTPYPPRVFSRNKPQLSSPPAR